MRISTIAGLGMGAALWLAAVAAHAAAVAPIALDWSDSGMAVDLPASLLSGQSGGSAVPAFAAPLGLDPLSETFQAVEPFSIGPAFSQGSLFDDTRFVGGTVAQAGNLRLQLGETQTFPAGSDLVPLEDPSQLQLSQAGSTRTLLAGAGWNFASWGGLGIAVAQTAATSPFGMPARFDLPNVGTMLGVSAHLNFGDGWVTSFSYDEGRSQLDLQPSALALAGEAKDGRAFGVTAAKDDIFGADAFGISLVRPTQPNDALLLAPQISLSSATPETDFQLDYETSFNGNITLQANAGYQMNVAGQNGTRALSVLSRAKINF